MENTTALSVVAVATFMLVTVALSVVACEWRASRRKAAELAATQRAFDGYISAEKEKTEQSFKGSSESFTSALQEAVYEPPHGLTPIPPIEHRSPKY